MYIRLFYIRPETFMLCLSKLVENMYKSCTALSSACASAIAI